MIFGKVHLLTRNNSAARRRILLACCTLLMAPLLSPSPAFAREKGFIGSFLDKFSQQKHQDDKDKSTPSNSEANNKQSGSCPSDFDWMTDAAKRWPGTCGTNRPPIYNDPSDPMSGFSGLWDIELRGSKLYSHALISIAKDHYGVGFGDETQGWIATGVARRNSDDHGIDGLLFQSPKLSSGGSISFRIGTSFVGQDVTGRPSGRSDRLVGVWRSDGKSGAAIWRRQPRGQFKTVVLNSNDSVPNPVVTIPYGMSYGTITRVNPPGCGYGSMRGNCPTAYVDILGDNLAGPHDVWIDPASHIEANVSWICKNGDTRSYSAEWTICGSDHALGDGVVGLRIQLILWDGVTPGPKTIWMDGKPVPFRMIIQNWKNAPADQAENETPKPALVALRAVGKDGAEIKKVTEAARFRLEAVFDRENSDDWVAAKFDTRHPMVNLPLGEDGPGEAVEIPEEATDNSESPSVTLWRTEDRKTFRSGWLHVEPVETTTSDSAKGIAP